MADAPSLPLFSRILPRMVMLVGLAGVVVSFLPGVPMAPVFLGGFFLLVGGARWSYYRRRAGARVAGRGLAFSVSLLGGSMALGLSVPEPWSTVAVFFAVVAFGLLLVDLPRFFFAGPVDPATSRLVLLALVFSPLVAAFGAGMPGHDHTFFLKIVASTLVATLVVVVLGPLVTRLVVRLLPRDTALRRLVRLSSESGASFDARGLLRMAAIPMLFAYAVAAWTDPFVAIDDPIQQTSHVLGVAFYVLALGVVIIVPWKWLFDLAGVRTYDPATGRTDEIRVPALLDDLIGLGAFLGLVGDSFGDGGAATWEGVGLGLMSLVYTLWYLLPVALVPTWVYVRYRMQKDLDAFVGALAPVAVQHMREMDG